MSKGKQIYQDMVRSGFITQEECNLTNLYLDFLICGVESE
jgi:hypothetical protein